MTRLVIYDDFQGYHGANVHACAREYYSGPAALMENQGGVLNFRRLFDAMESVSTSTRVFNVSFGASMGYADSLGEGVRQSDIGDPSLPQTVIYDHMKRLYDKNITLTIPAAPPSPKQNNIHPYAVNFLGTSGYSIVVGAHGDYSNQHPGFIDYMVDGCYMGACGTSHSAPRLAGMLASLQQDNGDMLTHAQVRSALDNASIYTHGHATPMTQPKHLGITHRLRCQALYRVYLNRNPHEYEMQFTMGRTEPIERLASEFKSRSEVQVPYDRVTPVQRICSLFHLFLNREATNYELSISLDYLNKTHDSLRNSTPCFKIDWGGYYVEFLNYIKHNGETIPKEFLF